LVNKFEILWVKEKKNKKLKVRCQSYVNWLNRLQHSFSLIWGLSPMNLY